VEAPRLGAFPRLALSLQPLSRLADLGIDALRLLVTRLHPSEESFPSLLLPPALIRLPRLRVVLPDREAEPAHRRLIVLVQTPNSAAIAFASAAEHSVQSRVQNPRASSYSHHSNGQFRGSSYGGGITIPGSFITPKTRSAAGWWRGSRPPSPA
jgi:hypothetical protein